MMKKVVIGFLVLAFFSAGIFLFKKHISNIGVASPSETLANYKKFAYGDYSIIPGSNNTRSVVIVLKSEGTLYEQNGKFKIQVSLPQSRNFDLILGDGKNRIFFATITQSQLGSQPNFVSENLTTLSQINPGDTLIATIPIHSKEDRARIRSLSDCGEYCQANLKKIEKYNTKYIDMLINDKTNKLAFLFENKRELGPALQLLKFDEN